MRECFYCGKPIPHRAEKGHREREYCDDVCRQRARRARNRQKHDLDRIMKEANERWLNAIEQSIQSKTWQGELEQKEKLLRQLSMGKWAQIVMMDATIGWIAARNGILRTVDGGIHWTPCFQCAPQLSSHSFSSFDSTTSATMGISLGNQHYPSSQSAIFHTSDGGDTWQQAILNARLVKPAHFVDSMHGWVVTTTGTPDFTLFRTSDGGKIWQKLSPGPQISNITDMIFQDVSSGWITQDIINRYGYMATGSRLLHTTDAGQTWHPVALSLPANRGISAPKFFSHQNGLFFLNTTIDPAPPRDLNTTIYITRDGGKAWTQRGSAPFSYLTTDNFIDLDHAWMNRPNNKSLYASDLYASNDGGLHWTRLSFQAPFAHIFSMSFVSPSLGFALGGPVPVSPEDGPDGVFKTSDGGLTWQELVRLSQTATG